MTLNLRSRWPAAALSFVLLNAISHASNAAALALHCSELAQTSWFSTDSQKPHYDVVAGHAGGLISADFHSIQIDETKGSALLDVLEPGGHNNPAWGQVKAKVSATYINIFNVIPTSHADAVTRIKIGIDRSTGVYLWQEETLGANDAVGVTNVHTGICSTSKPKL